MYRIGKKQKRTLMGKNGHEVALFAKGQEEVAQSVCDFLNYDGWIRVEDRLPEEGEFILIKATSNKDLITIGFLTPLKPKQWHVTERNIGIIPFRNVSHWMPLPKPPTP